MLHLIPAPIHRALLPLAYRLRHHWRKWRKVPLMGCAVIISDLDGAIIMLRHSYGPAVWALPGGGVSKGEDPAEAAKREVREELKIELQRIELVAELTETVSGAPHTTYLYAAKTDQYPQIDKREIDEARYFPRHSLPEPQGVQTRFRLDTWRESLQK